jgi:hypothetical protein
MSSYQQHCEDYALHGDPMRDHYDYEENARYDRFDGWGDPDPYDDPDGHLSDAELAALENLDELEDYEEIDENGVAFDDYPDDDDIPF